MATHVNVLAWLFVGLGLLGLAGGFAMGIAFEALAGAANADPVGSTLLGLTGVTLAIGLVGVAAPAVLCGWGLLRSRPWARLLGIVLAAVSSIVFPHGTVFGIYALWVLLRQDTERVFDVTS